MEWFIIIIVVAIILGIGSFIFQIIKEEKKVEEAKNRFEDSRTLQNNALKEILSNTGAKVWTIKEIKRIQGSRRKDIATRKDNIEGTAGIYAFYIEDENIDINEYFIPIYVGKTNNIRKRWIQHVNKIEKAYWNKSSSEIKYQKIAHYLRLKNQTPSSIRFLLLEKISDKKYFDICKEREKYWIELSGSGERGFNSVKA